MAFENRSHVEMAATAELRASSRDYDARRRPLAVWLGILVVGVAVSGAGAKPVQPVTTRLYVNYSHKPDPQDLATFDLCILDAEAQVDLAPGHTLGHTYLAYISTVEARPGSTCEKLAAANKVPFVGANADWGTRLLDITHPDWKPMFIDGLAKPALDRGFDGFFLDTIDSAELLVKQSPQKAGAYRKALEGLIKDLHRQFPKAKIVVNRGFGLIDKIAADINGVLVESVLQSFDPKTRSYKAVSAEDRAWLEARIREVQMRDLKVYAVDYVDPTQKDLARQTAEKLSALGCIPFVTTPELNGTALAPLSEVPRRVLVLYGWDADFADKPAASPADTLTGRQLQRTLNWLGFAPEYLDAGSETLPAALPPRFAAVIVDGTLALRPDQEKTAARWLAQLARRRTPVLFVGGLPFADEDARAEFASAFALSGTMETVRGITAPAITRLDAAMMTGGDRLQPRAAAFRDLAAPAGAQVFLSLRGEDAAGRAVRFDPVFLCSWGGMWLDPYVLTRPADDRLVLADALRFLTRWLEPVANTFPVPDTTTRDGRRLFYSHVSGDGFSSLAQCAGHPMCAEVIRSRVLQQHPLPVSVSLAESDVETPAEGDGPLDKQRRQNVARSILTLANVEALPREPDTTANGASRAPAGSFAAFGDVIERFKSSDLPFRLAPVFLQHDFAAAAQPASRLALEKIYEWCSAQPLHPVSAFQYAAIAGDAVRTKFHQVAPRHWLVANAGQMRTFRIPASAGVPDLPLCRGIAGWKTQGDVTYVHTTGRMLTELVLTDAPAAVPEYLRLVESSADIQIHELSARGTLFNVGGWTTVDVVFSGMPPHTMVAVKKNLEQGRLETDATGTLKLSLPPHSTVSLSVSRAPYAVAR